MKKIIPIILIIIIFLISLFITYKIGYKMADKNCSTCNCETNPQESLLTFSFLKLENNHKNMLYSPLSIAYATKMLEAGANGNTKTQIEDILKGTTLKTYQNIPDKLSLANGLFIREDFKEDVKSSFINTLTNDYGAEVIYDPFTSVDNINEWISNKTFKLIPRALDELNEDTELILTNAIAIDMNWASAFNEETITEDFTKVDNTTTSIEMLRGEFHNDNVSYYQDDNLTVLKMNLEQIDDTQFEYDVIMPSNIDNYISNLNINTLNNDLNKTVTSRSTDGGIFVHLPKQKFNYSLDLQDDLISLGMIDAFNSDTANFSKMSNISLHVGKAVHKATIEVSEEGVKAAAVTIYSMDKASVAQDEPKNIKIDKPFVFIIRDKSDNTILFVGAYYGE